MKKMPKKMVNSQKMMTFMLVISTAAVFVIISLGTIILRREVKELPPPGNKSSQVYTAYYALVVEDTKDLFWQNVYKAAKEEGKKQNIFVELVGDDLLKNYSVADKFKIALASKADGIMVAPAGEDMEPLLMEASKEGIPVVTLLDDCLKGERESFVGINSADIASLYVDAVKEINREMDDDASNEVKKVMILIDAEDQLNSKNLMCLSISEALAAQGLSVEVKPIDRNNAFSAEEIIRDTILSARKVPDILICLSTEDTLCAYQAVIDYNKVGDVAIMGYYQSETLMEGIAKGIIDTTLFIDSEQMGRQGVEALNSFREKQQVNAYFTVGVKIINEKNVAEYIYAEEKGE